MKASEDDWDGHARAIELTHTLQQHMEPLLQVNFDGICSTMTFFNGGSISISFCCRVRVGAMLRHFAYILRSISTDSSRIAIDVG
jgi:hypothetical protein